MIVVLVLIPVLFLFSYLYYRKIFLDQKCFALVDIENEEEIEDKIIIVTGANSGVGLATTEELAMRGATIIMACRNLRSCEDAIKSIRKVTQKGNLIPIELDLASLDSVNEFAEEIKRRYTVVDILINNAGLYSPVVNNVRKRTIDGFEVHFGINYLGHFLLTQLLLDLLKKSDISRVVNVGSIASKYGIININDLNGDKDCRIPITNKATAQNFLYSNSKKAIAWFSFELARREPKINTYYLCPGMVKTNALKEIEPKNWIRRKMFHLVFGITAAFFFKTPFQGCQTVLYCSIGKKCGEESGKNYRNCKLWDDEKFIYPDDIFAHGKLEDFKENETEKLYTASLKLCRKYFKEF